MGWYPSTNQPIPTGKRRKVAEAVKKNGQWRVKCYKCGLLPTVYRSWTAAATDSWRHGKH